MRKSDYKNYLQQKASDNNSVKKEAIVHALRETYSKYSRLENPNMALRRVKQAMYKYITAGFSNGFTRDGSARKNLEDNVSKEEFLDFIIEDYVQKCISQAEVTIPEEKSLKEQAFSDAIVETIQAYSSKQAEAAVKEFIRTGKTSMFTNRGNSRARTTLAHNVFSNDALTFLIDSSIEKELFNNQRFNQYANTTTYTVTKTFSHDDFELVGPPKDRSLFKKAIDWIKEKMTAKEVHSKNDLNKRANSKQKNDNDYYER